MCKVVYQTVGLLVIACETICGFRSHTRDVYRRRRVAICLEHRSSREKRSADDDVINSLSTLSSKLFTAITERNMDETALLNSRIKDLQLRRTYVGDSTITGGGRGLFASCDCRAGDLLTCYPGDVLVSTKLGEKEEWNLQWGDHVQEIYRTVELRDDQRACVLQATDGIGILGLSELDDDSAYLGHFCNDGATTTPTCMAELAPYVLESQDIANASHQDICNCSHMVTVALRAIKTGEEIFVSYGPDYWMEHNGFP